MYPIRDIENLTLFHYVVHSYPLQKIEKQMGQNQAKARFLLCYFQRDKILKFKFNKNHCNWNVLKVSIGKDLYSLMCPFSSNGNHSVRMDRFDPGARETGRKYRFYSNAR